MKVSALKQNILDFLLKIIKSEEYKQLRIVYVIAFAFSIITYLLGPNQMGGDTDSYYFAAKDKILNGIFDQMRTPFYPIFLILTLNSRFTILFQYFVFFVSIAYLYRTLETIKISPRLIFITMIIYVCHPIFLYYQNQKIPESLCISLMSMFAYYLLMYIKNEKILDCWIFNILILILVLLKPGCIFLLSMPVLLIIYMILLRRKLKVSILLPFIFVFLLIGSYSLSMKKNYGVNSISNISDINFYWMLRERDLINIDSIKNNDEKNFIMDKIDIKYEYFPFYIDEAIAIINQYGWKELHSIVQSSLKENYKSFFLSRRNFNNIRQNLHGFVGKSIDHFTAQNKHFEEFGNLFLCLNFYHLLLILLFYSTLIVKYIYTVRNIPIISILFLSCIVIHFFSLILTAPNNYGRLIVPSIPIILIVCTQCFEWIVLFVLKKEKQFKLA